VCYGCGQTLKPGGKIGDIPYDLVIVSNAMRRYKDQNGEIRERSGNVYFHVHQGCLKRHQPYFIPAFVEVPQAIKNFLTDSHIALIRQFGIIL